jgi:hypothetical protein
MCKHVVALDIEIFDNFDLIILHTQKGSHTHTSVHPCDTQSPTAIHIMTPSDIFVMQMINFLAAAGFLLLASSRDAALLYSARFDRTPVHMSRLTGQMWIDELVGRHPRRFYNEMGLCKHIFMKLVMAAYIPSIYLDLFRFI